MHGSMRTSLTLSLVLTSSFGMLATPAFAQDEAAVATGDSRSVQAAQLFVHYVLIAKADEAASNAAVLLAEELSAADLARLVEANALAGRMDDAFRRGRGMAGVADQLAAVESKLETGRKELAREHARIATAVSMLSGPVRGQMLAKDRLLAAGEYAVPALLLQVVESRTPGADVSAGGVLVEMKRPAALPLAMALPSLDPASQRKVALILGEIGYPVAIPVLLDIAQREGVTPDVQTAAMNAVRAIGGTDSPASVAYAAQAGRFLGADPTLIAFPDEATQNVWNWSESGGLGAQQVSTPLYFDVLAMRFAQRALELEPGNHQALALFIAADLRREARMTDDMVDPMYAGGGRSAQYFATLAGPAIMQDVLALGLAMNDTGLVRSALAALRETAGADQMIVQGGSPVVQCLLYPDRRVQFEAALSLAGVSPTAGFAGAEQVVPTLAQAVRSGGQLFAGIVAPSTEDAQRFATTLTAAGYVPLTAVQDAEGFGVVSARHAGSDLVVIGGSASSIKDTFASLRARREGLTLPVLVVAQPNEMTMLSELEKDGRTVVIGAGVSDEAFAAGIQAVMARTYGGAPSAEDMSRFVPQSIDALMRIGVKGSSIYRIEDAERGLVEALRSQEGPVRVGVANVLALVPTDTAQRALIETALAASGDEQAMLFVPVASSARRWGSFATPQQANGVRMVVESATGALGNAASAAYGALNLPPSQAVDMILKARKPGQGASEGESGSEGGGSSGGM
ncbi:MAG: hypothetical protein JNK53_03355 [Phycisphaerae bacterium]|nr:hypothetical protein [Phycisphaerae bacterium]